ncbi:MAG: hypothetical protein Q4G34_01415 [Micrococcus sp.]|nr:hypothetical protein [Micrococcus sp.]
MIPDADPALPWLRAELGRILGENGPLSPSETTVEIKRQRAWGELWTVTARGRVFWFKRPALALAGEVGLRAILEARCPEHVLPLLAADPETGWMVTEDQGPVLAARAREDGPHHYVALARALAEVQRSVTDDDVAALVAAGVAVFDPLDAVARLDEQLAPFAGLEREHRAHCSSEDRAAALEAMAGVVQDWRRLHASAPTGLLPGLSVDHNDLHGGNAFVDVSGAVRITDWGDAVVAPPFASLRALLGPVRTVFGMGVADEVRAEYVAAWAGPDASAFELALVDKAVETAMRLAVAQRLSCWTALADPAAWAEYADYIVPLWREAGVPVRDTTVG